MPNKVILFMTIMLSVVLVSRVTGVEKIILDQDFESLPLGPIADPYGTNGVGSTADTGGRWRQVGTIYPDPSIVNTVAYSGTQSYRISRLTAGENSIGWTYVESAPQGMPFEFSYWVNPVSGGSWIVAANNYDYIQTNTPVSVYIDPSGNLQARELRDDGNLIWRDTGVDIAIGSWTGIKAVVKSWGDGTSTVAGRGFYDVYTNTGSGWVQAYSDVGFNSSMLYDGINAVFVIPQAPANSISGYMDDVNLLVTPLTCADVFTIGNAVDGDLYQDCRIDLKDFAKFASDWLFCNDPEDTGCTANW